MNDDKDINLDMEQLTMVEQQREDSASFNIYLSGLFLQFLKLQSAIKNTSLAAKGALAHCLQCRTAWKIQNGRYGPQNGRRGLERCLPLDF